MADSDSLLPFGSEWLKVATLVAFGFFLPVGVMADAAVPEDESSSISIDNAWHVVHGAIREINAIAVSSDDQIWVAGSNFGLLSANGLRAIDYRNEPLGLKEIEFCGADCGWATAWSAFYRYDGEEWAIAQRTDIDLYDLDLVGNTGWAIGRGSAGETKFLQLHRDEWLVEQEVPDSLTTVSMWSESLGWAAGRGGAVYEFSAGAWTLMESFTDLTINDVFAVSPTEVWVVGGSLGIGTSSMYVVFSFDGIDWREVIAGTGFVLYAVGGNSDAVVAVGEDGHFLVFRAGSRACGGVSRPRYHGAGTGLRGVLCEEGRPCYIASDDGRLLGLDDTCNVTTLHDSREVNGLLVTDSDQKWIVGEFGAKSFGDGEWEHADVSNSILMSIATDWRDRIWVAGMGGYIAVNNDGLFHRLEDVPRLHYRDIDVLPSGDLCVLGTTSGPASEVKSHIIAVDPVTLIAESIGDMPIEDVVVDVYCSATSKVLLAAGASGLWEYDGTIWTMTVPGEWFSVLQVEDGIWLGGRGVLAFIDSRGVSRVDLPGNTVVVELIADTGCGVVAVGSYGVVLRLEGREWRLVSEVFDEADLIFSIPRQFETVFCASSSEPILWAGGSEATIIMADPLKLDAKPIPTGMSDETAVPFTPIGRTGTPTGTPTVLPTSSPTPWSVLLPRLDAWP